MQPTPAHTRARTLQGRLGTQQNGSTSVRSSGRLAEELIPDQRYNVENVEGDYSDELRRLETFMNEDSVDNDYDLEMGEDDDEHAVTTPAAERLFGGEDGFQTYAIWARAAAKVDGTHYPRDRLTRGDAIFGHGDPDRVDVTRSTSAFRASRPYRNDTS